MRQKSSKLEVSDLSYRDKLNAGREARKKIRATVMSAAKITVIVLAAMVLLATVLVIVDMANNDNKPVGGDISGAGDGGADNVPPVINLKSGDCIYVTIGETISYREQVIVTDNSGNYTLKFNSDNVNTDKEGIYKITYTATDAKGNVTEKTFSVVVKKAEYSYAQMESLIKKKAEALGISTSMSKKKIVEKVYDYVNSPTKSKNEANFKFDNESNIPNINRANWEGDWVEEAIRAIGSGEGDCYSYYSVSKAFFTVFGIEHKGIKRDSSLDADWGTHFWLIVNIGDTTSPQWYYYDATRLAGEFGDGTRNACLITLDKLRSYSSTDGIPDFYKFDPTKYPTASTTEVK